MSLNEALWLYAQFLKEFPSSSLEMGTTLDIVLASDAKMYYVVKVPTEDPITNRYAGDVFTRVLTWFNVQPDLKLDRADTDRLKELHDLTAPKIETDSTLWFFSVLVPVFDANGELHYEYV